MFKPVLPSSLLKERKENDTDFSYMTSLFDNKYLRVGVVVEAIDVEDEENLFKLGPEYNVMTSEQNADGSISTVFYNNCMRLNSFGSISDFFFAKMRTPKDQQKVTQSGSSKNQEGSVVLLLCLDGNSEKAIIIGSLDHPQGQKLGKELGHHMEGEFNGVNWQVNKDGELTVTFKSASDNEGKYQDEEAGGSFLKIDKTGSIDINNDKTENIKIDKAANTIDINAEKDISLTTKANVKITAEENLEAQLKKDLILMAEGKATIEIKEKVNFKTDSDVVAKMKNLQAEVQNAVQLKLQTANILAQQLILNSTTGVQVTSQQMIMQSPLILLGPQPQPAVMIKTKYVGVGNLGVPVVSSPVGPFSASVFVSE